MQRPKTATSRRSDERGFTLPELLITILLIGVLSTIGTVSWMNVTENRRLVSATNQLAADLRLAHSSATNQLRPWEVVLVADSLTYAVRPLGETGVARNLPDGIEIGSTATIGFNPNGSAAAVPGATTFRVRAVNNTPPGNDITLTPTTSRIRIAP